MTRARLPKKLSSSNPFSGVDGNLDAKSDIVCRITGLRESREISHESWKMIITPICSFCLRGVYTGVYVRCSTTCYFGDTWSRQHVRPPLAPQQHRLCFLPEPQGHISLRPALVEVCRRYSGASSTTRTNPLFLNRFKW